MKSLPGSEIQSSGETVPLERSHSIGRIANRLAPAVTMVLIVAVWEFSCDIFKIPEFLFPAPSAIWRAAFSVSASQWIGHIFSTLRVALMGYGAAILISIPLAVLIA